MKCRLPLLKCLRSESPVREKENRTDREINIKMFIFSLGDTQGHLVRQECRHVAFVKTLIKVSFPSPIDATNK
jgi:hypothetical protein